MGQITSFEVLWKCHQVTVSKTCNFERFQKEKNLGELERYYWNVLFLVHALFGLCSLWFMLFLVHALFPLCCFWFVLFLVCSLFGMCLFGNMPFLECVFKDSAKIEETVDNYQNWKNIVFKKWQYPFLEPQWLNLYCGTSCEYSECSNMKQIRAG